MPWYTEEEIKKAWEILTIDYLKQCEPHRLKKCKYLRHEYELTDHDSFKINEVSSIWHWKSQDIGGKSALKFLQVVDGVSFVDAISKKYQDKTFVHSYAGVCMEGAVIALACIIFSVFAASPPSVADSSLSAVNIVWNYVAELIFNLLVLVGAIKAADRIVKEMMGL